MQRVASAAVRVARRRGGPYLQVTTGKKDGQINKSWVFCYALNKREHQKGLGSLNAIDLSLAREESWPVARRS